MKRMIIVDGNSLMYRAYYGMRPTTTSKGLYTNAIYGFIKMINHLLTSKYDNFLVAFDAGKKTIRHELMADYKAGRPPMPDEFRMQIAYIKEYLNIIRVKQYEQDLYEADDIIGTMSKKAEEAGYHVDIYSSDRDLLQLISNNVTVHMNKVGMSEMDDYTPEFFYERYQINYNQFIDLKALMGDKSDNLPGIPGIGEKKAVKLLQKYETLENIIAKKDEITGADGEKVRNNYESAILTKKMATILRDFPINLKLEDTIYQEYDKSKLQAFYEELEFKSLLKELNTDSVKVDETFKFKLITPEYNLDDILTDESYLVFETYEYNYHRCPILAIGIANQKGIFVLDGKDIFRDINLSLYLSNPNMHKYIYDYKRAFVLCKRLGIDLVGVEFDLLLATYILNSNIAHEEFKSVAAYYDYYDLNYDEEIYGKGAKKAMPQADLLYMHVAKKAKALQSLCEISKNKLKENNQLHLLTDIEIPLSRVLGKMEFEGVFIDKDELNRQERELSDNIASLEKKIYEIVGHEFNISSPKQLGSVLFEELNLPYPKKKSTSYSTDIEVLEAIKGLNPVVELVIKYRNNTKLYSTYIKGLAENIYPDGKIHTIFEQALTSTGRLSSIDPNLQNIPIRTPEGHLIRKMFVPMNKEDSLYSADYSQIELRILAHMAKVTKLQQAFINGEDIHTKTAQEVFGKTDITPLDRRRAKAVNFGIVYGISAYGLANDLGISNIEASNFIKKYYEIYPEIPSFMEKTVEFCKEHGYVTTLENRYRYIPEINSKIYMQREFAKRMAMNAPIQGSAADLMKIAMIKVDKALEDNHLQSKILIQVHDELVLEVKHGEEEIVSKLVKENMEHAYKLDIPLVADDSFGKNWHEVK